MVDPMLKFYGTFLYFWRLCFSYDLDSNYITKQDILDSAETTNMLSKNAVAADGKRFQESIADKKYYKRSDLLNEVIQWGLAITQANNRLEARVSHFTKSFTEAFADYHMNEEIFNSKILVSDIVNKKIVKFDKPLRKLFMVIGHKNR
jgi:hypothetical protein